MNVLFVGDVQGHDSIIRLGKALPGLKKEQAIDAVIVNGENSSDHNGISAISADMLFEAGADVITTGNHAFKRKDADDAFNRRAELLRPANFGEPFPDGYCPGKGVHTIDFGGFGLAVINIVGMSFMGPCDNPFKCVDDILKNVETKNIIVDFHAEATSEKKAMGYYLSGRVSAVLGTHTHVQTADERILDGHTAYITDVGMTGAIDSVIGAGKNVVEGFVGYYPQRHFFAGGVCQLNAAVVGIDTECGRAEFIKRIIREI